MSDPARNLLFKACINYADKTELSLFPLGLRIPGEATNCPKLASFVQFKLSYDQDSGT